MDLNWEERQIPVDCSLRWVTFGGGLFVAVGDLGHIFTSSDGMAWKSNRLGLYYDLKGATHGKGQFVAVGSGGTLCFNPDSVRPLHSDQFRCLLHRVTYGGGRFIAVGEAMSMSSDAYLFMSETGIGWVDCTPPGTMTPLRGVTYGRDRYVAVGGEAVTSEDGVNWKVYAHALDRLPGLNDLVFGEDEFLAVGERGCIVRSTDGIAWTSCSSPTTQRLASVIYGQGMYVAVGNNVLITSHDGDLWEVAEQGTPTLRSVAFGNGRFVAISDTRTVLVSC